MSPLAVAVTLPGPICGCQYQEIGWNVINSDGRGLGFIFDCNLCHAQLFQPIAGQRASIIFTQPYPKGVKSTAQKGLEAARGFLGSLKKGKDK